MGGQHLPAGSILRCAVRYVFCSELVTYPDIQLAGLTESQVKAQLAEEEEYEAARGNPALHRVTPSSIIAELLEIEDLQ